MEIGVLGYIGSRNIGDYIQTKAVIDMIHPTNHKVLDREALNKFKGSKLKTIINGWFMENPKNWPPIIIYPHYLFLFILILQQRETY